MAKEEQNHESNEPEDNGNRDYLKWSFIVMIILVIVLVILIQINFPDIAE